MALDFNRFIQGFTGSVVGSIEKREEADREKKKAELLESLRRDTYKWQKEIDAMYAKRDADKDMTQFDYDKGVKILKNKDGDVLREVPLTKSEMTAYSMDRRGAEAKLKSAETDANFAERKALSELARDQAAIDASRASASNSRASAGLTAKQMRALDASSSGTSSLNERANELASRQKVVVEDLVKSGVPAELVQQTAIRSIKESAARNGTISPEDIFLRAANVLRQQQRKNPDNPATAKPLSGGGF